MKLTLFTYNTLNGGLDGSSDHRLLAQLALVQEIEPDVFLMQEARGLHDNGNAGLHALEHKIGMRGFLALAPHTGQNIAIFVREHLKPLSFQSDAIHFHHTLATLRVALPGSGQPITFMSAHLCPNGAGVRQREAAYLAPLADPSQLALVAGDFNSASPHDPEPFDFKELLAHHRARYLDDELQSADRKVLASLEAAGWADIGHHLDKEVTPTVPTSSFISTEFATMRCDYVLATAKLAACAKSYAVIRTPITDVASDHYPIVATFELPA